MPTVAGLILTLVFSNFKCSHLLVVGFGWMRFSIRVGRIRAKSTARGGGVLTLGYSDLQSASITGEAEVRVGMEAIIILNAGGWRCV